MRVMPEELKIGPNNSDRYTWNLANGTADYAKPVSEPDLFQLDSNQRNMSPYVLGVVLADDRSAGRMHIASTADNFVALGVILLDNPNINAEELRRLMCTQLPTLPASFSFLTKQGWPVERLQECTIKSYHIITERNSIMIKRLYDGLRVGILSTSGECVGFVFINSSWNVSQIREAINEQLKEVRKNAVMDYRFLEKTGWPVTLLQESVLSAVDVIRLGNHICIEYTSKHLSVCYQEPSVSQVKLPPPPILPLPTLPCYPKDKADGKTWPEIKKPSWKIKKIESLRRKKDELSGLRVKGDLVAKPILISYVRAEASQHALLLKNALEDAGFSVFLDVHEIKTGSDWQDALNYAVSNCQFFVPLITPMYGKTQWTNREVKLADVLQKTIIPISFLEQWPPECLAIQFASTQYIPWKPQEGDHGRIDADTKPTSCDSEIWSTVYIRRVCIEIAEKCRLAFTKTDIVAYCPTPRPDKLRREIGASAASNPSEDVSGPILMRSTTSPKKTANKNLVVISAHPKQRILVHELKVTLENEGWDVWYSPDILDPMEQFGEDSFPSNPNTPRELPSIPEGNTVLAQAYSDIANSIADSKKFLVKTDGDISFEKKPLTRMISQVSDISQVSSLTPDKLERLKTFQQKADQAGVVIIIVSESYTKSKTSQQQVFYCEHRKQVILIKFDQSVLPSWFTMLMGSDMITNVQSPQFMTTLKIRVKRALNPSSSETPKDAAAEAKMQFLVNFMKKSLPVPETCVYIAGSSKLQNYRSEEIAKALGRELAKVQNITLCTGGFFGAPEITARTFNECVENNRDKSDLRSSSDPLVHLLPFKDSKDFSSKALQNTDGSFEALSFGKTIFLGDSVKERETAVARLFDTCIVIEGGPGAAHEVEEFIWNDHFVIPIISTGGAAGGQYGVPLKIFEAPPCVSKNDWLLLTEKEAKPEDVAKAVVNIVVAIKQSIATHNSSRVSQLKTAAKPKARNRSRKHKAATIPQTSPPVLRDGIVQTPGPENPNINGHRLLQRQSVSFSDFNTKRNYRASSRWQRFLRIFSATKIS